MPDMGQVGWTERCTQCGARPEPSEAAAAPIMHCEWCGAEHPIPSAR